MSDSGYCVGGMMYEQLINTHLDSYTFALSFSPVALDYSKCRGVCRVSGRCLEGAWRLSE